MKERTIFFQNFFFSWNKSSNQTIRAWKVLQNLLNALHLSMVSNIFGFVVKFSRYITICEAGQAPWLPKKISTLLQISPEWCQIRAFRVFHKKAHSIPKLISIVGFWFSKKCNSPSSPAHPTNRPSCIRIYFYRRNNPLLNFTQPCSIFSILSE